MVVLQGRLSENQEKGFYSLLNPYSLAEVAPRLLMSSPDLNYLSVLGELDLV